MISIQIKYNVLDRNINSSRIKTHSSFYNLVSRYISDNQVGKRSLEKSITQAKIIQILLILYILILIYLLNK